MNHILLLFSTFTLSYSDCFIITELLPEHVTIEMSTFPSIPTSGNNVNITCQATVPESLQTQPSFVLISYDVDGKDVVDNSQDYMRKNNTYSTSVTLQRVNTTDAGRYYCVIDFSDLNVTAYGFTNLSMYSK